ncbi:hypothetical protein OAJ58_00890 [Nitrosopumilus sp.]|jgi:O-antigen/teichoic acid export membrane protein|nr:hypothetical protein [Nitrosopumilus sp.]
MQIKNFSSILFADGIGAIFTAIFWILFASLIEPEQYGEIAFLLGIASFVTTISIIGTQETLTVYLAKKVKIESTFYFLGLVIGIISSLVVLLIFYRLDLIFLIFAYMINVLAIGELLGKKLYKSYAKYVLIQKISTLILGLGFFYLFGIDGILYALAITYVMYAIRIFQGFKNSKINFSLLKPRKGFIATNYTLVVTTGLQSQLDKFIIAPLLGFALLGNYALALQIIGIMMIFPSVLFKFILPQDSSKVSNKKFKQISILISVLIAITGFLLAPILIPELFPKYTDVILAIQIMSFNVIVATINYIRTSKFLGLEKSKYLLMNKIIQILVLVSGMVILGTTYGITGLAVAFVLNSLSSLIFLTIIEKIKKI